MNRDGSICDNINLHSFSLKYQQARELKRWKYANLVIGRNSVLTLETASKDTQIFQ